jgi:Flp pilus assembly protein TadD
VLGVLGGSPPVAATPVTFTRDIAPIVYAKCGTCHRPGGAAPFSLLTYESARPHATQMAAATASHFMPPWKTDEAFAKAFIAQPHLTESEISAIAAWVRDGAPEGDARDLPRPPRWTEGWQLGKPDLIVSPPAYTLPAEGTDVFRVFVIPLPTSGTKYVRGLEFHPGNARVVHHANIRIDPTGISRKYDDADPAPGYEGLIARAAVYPDGHFLGWTPGQAAPLLPRGLAWRLQPSTDLVVELHMQPSGRVERVQPEIGFYFGSDPPGRMPAMLRLGRQSIDIPAGEKSYTIADSFLLPVDVEVQAVQPHAHYRAREISGAATLPDGTVRPLIRIGDWDFRWQHVYRYATPFWLPKGTTLSMRYTYDNSAANPRNPSQPPLRVRWGQRSADEMGDLWIQVLTRDERDLATLNAQFRPKVVAEDLVGYEQWIRAEPDSAALHDDAALLYLEAKRPDEAVRHFAASARLSPASPSAHFNLGTALTVAGRVDEARREYERALALKPDYAQAHNNLGSILLNSGRTPEAMEHLARAVEVDPNNAQAYFNLASAYASAGDLARAVKMAEKAVALEPNNQPMRDALARFRQSQKR